MQLDDEQNMLFGTDDAASNGKSGSMLLATPPIIRERC